MKDSRADLVRVQPRPNTIYLSRGRMVLATARDGSIDGGPDRGLFAYQTRLLSRYRYLIDGKPPHPVAHSSIDQHRWLGYYTQVPPGRKKRPKKELTGTAADTPAQHVLELQLHRSLDTRFREEILLTNYTQETASFTLELEVEADFADPKETRKKRKQTGELDRSWQASGEGHAGTLSFDYRAEHSYDHQGEVGTGHLHRGCTLTIQEADTSPRFDEGHGRIRFEIELSPRASWRAALAAVPTFDDAIQWRSDGKARRQHYRHGRPDELTNLFLEEATRVRASETDTLAPVVTSALDRARRDLAALRLFDLDHGRRAWTVAAGVPLYIALFGRDTLTTAWQAALLGPEMMTGTLEELERWQGTETNDWRDEQPGRLLHEAQTGPLATLNFTPHARYYGSMTTSAFYPFVVSELWHWTGNEKMARRLLGPARKAVEWLDEYGDFDDDGFYEYKMRSKKGAKNQGWKDSGEALVHADGSQVKAPIATCELQGFAYAAKRRLAELCWWTGHKGEARRFYREAEALKERFNETFWIEEEATYAMGLDAVKRPIRSVGSDPGHCVATGIVEEERVRQVVNRLFEADMYSGWGVRTLSSSHPAYNPYSYQRGSVWPVEHGTFAVGLMRYGLIDEMHRLCRGQFEAAALFGHCRLPEVFSGHQRTEEQPFPATYPPSNSPQAWSASAVFCMVQSMLGIYPYAPLNLLLIDPHLPEWLPELTVEGLRVGDAVVSIRFFRKSSGTTSYEVTAKEGRLHVVRQPSPWSLTAGFGERVQDALTSLVPGS